MPDFSSSLRQPHWRSAGPKRALEPSACCSATILAAIFPEKKPPGASEINLRVPEPPRQSNERIFVLITYQNNAQGAPGPVFGTWLLGFFALDFEL
jgi:hypothetical protein